MRDIIINGVKIRPGQNIQLDINIARLPTHTLIDLPVFIYRSKVDGPVLLVSGGLHGDEINGIDAVKRMITDNMLKPKRGTVVAIPLINVYGFLSTSRTFPDGRDLNRSFPGSKKGSLASQIAHILTNEILPNIDMGIDFHTGGRMLSNYPQVRADFKDEKSVALAKAFGAPFIINSGLIDKSFRKEAYKKGKPILVYEGGESMRLDELVVKEAIEGTQRLMHHLQMKDQVHEPRESIVMAASTWERAKVSGIFNPTVQYGEKVKKGQMLAKITDPYGRVKVPVKSPYDGYVICLNNLPVVNAGDALIHIGKVE